MVLTARILLFVLIVAVAAALGAVAGFFGLYLLGVIMGADDQQGALAMGSVSAMPVGGIAGAALGAWLAWRTVRGLDGRAAMAAGFGLAGFAALGAAGWYGLTLYERGSPYEAGEEPTVLIEWRLPDIVPPADVLNYRHTMRSTFKDWTLNTEWDDPVAREEDGRTVLRFRGEIRWRRAGRIFQLWKFPAHNERITVELNLGADPQAADSYGPWKEVSAAPGHAFRTRVVR